MLSTFNKTIVLILLLYTGSIAIAHANRVALVIGNSEYPLGKLATPVNDAIAIKNVLQAKGFDVSLLKNASKRQMKQAIKLFNKKLHKANAVGFFYFSGHGVEINGKNFLLPVDAEINNESEVEFEGIDIRRILTGMQWAGNYLNMLVLDASRDNPYTLGFRKSSSGLSKVDAVKNSLILFATSPGNIISEGKKKNGLFSAQLIAAINNPNLKAEEIFKQTAKKTSQVSSNAQIPWLSGLSVNEFYFTEHPKVLAKPKQEKPSTPSDTFKNDVEVEFWISIKDSKMASYFEAYLKKYGEQGQFTLIAQIKLAELKKKPVSTVTKSKLKTPPPQPKPQIITPVATAKPKPIPIPPAAFPLFIKIHPEKAQIKIINIKPKFKQGMLLPIGSYHIVVSSSGYKKHSQWVKLVNKPLSVVIRLNKDQPKVALKPEKPVLDSKQTKGETELHKGDEFYLKHFDYKTSVAWYRKSAELGNPVAQATLAKLYYNGLGVKKDLRKSKSMGKKAYPDVLKLSLQGNRDAQFALANLFQFGLGISRNYATAFSWYQKAAEQNLASAQNNLGAMYKIGHGVQQSYKQAVQWYHRAAEQGDALAQYNLAQMFEIGQGVKKDKKQTFKWYLKAAMQGDPYSQNKLGNLYLSGRGVNKDLLQAANWYRQAAKKGDASGQTHLGIMYVTGSGVKKNPEKAVFWFRKAAQQGDANGQNKLGIMYQAGEGLQQDFKQAVHWFRRSAEQGNAGGQTNLGYMYQYGKGVEQSSKQAVLWYTRASDQGDANGRYLLAVMYETGQGIKQDMQEAVYLYNKASMQGHKKAKLALDRLRIK